MKLVTFADKLEKATIDTIESGTMTKDLALITTLENVNTVNSEDFIKAIRCYFRESFKCLRVFERSFPQIVTHICRKHFSNKLE